MDIGPEADCMEAVNMEADCMEAVNMEACSGLEKASVMDLEMATSQADLETLEPQTGLGLVMEMGKDKNNLQLQDNLDVYIANSH
jgi:hypothetical protein